MKVLPFPATLCQHHPTLTMCFDFLKFLCVREAKGVCLAQSLKEDNLPKKVKVSVVKHRFSCKLGLCTVTDLVTFRFPKPRWLDFVKKER